MVARIRFSEAVSSLYVARQRTIIVLLGIVIGIGAVIAMISVGAIYKNESIKQFKELGTDLLTIRKLRDRSADNPVTLRLADIMELSTEVSSIAAVAPWISTQGEFMYAGKQVGRGGARGVTASFADLRKLQLSAGRFISDLDFRRHYCVIGADIARAMRSAGVGRLVGESIKLKEHAYTIVGVLRAVPVRQDFNANRSILIPITTAQRTFANNDIREMVARMQPGVHHTVAAADLKTYFRGKSTQLRLRVVSAKQLIDQIQKQTQLITLLLGAVGSITLIVGGVGVMNVMLVSVAERRKEIGIRRALGARRRDIQGQFLMESVILSMIGGVFGTAVGIASTWFICRYAGWTFEVSATSVMLGLGVASCIGIFFGFYPAYHAARLDPITALRAS